MDTNQIFKHSYIRILPALIWTGITFYICFLPGSELPKYNFLDKIYFDKIVHIAIYCIMLLLVIFSNIKYKYIKLIAIVWCISVGLLIEFVQGNYIANRSADIYDVVANIVGITIGYYLYHQNSKIAN